LDQRRLDQRRLDQRRLCRHFLGVGLGKNRHLEKFKNNSQRHINV
jgi:hypothetical protein